MQKNDNLPMCIDHTPSIGVSLSCCRAKNIIGSWTQVQSRTIEGDISGHYCFYFDETNSHVNVRKGVIFILNNEKVRSSKEPKYRRQGRTPETEAVLCCHQLML